MGMGHTVKLDTVVASLCYFLPKWTPTLRRNASRDLLRLLVCKLYGASKGNLFQARIQASQDALADSVGISRVWTNQLLARLKEQGWIEIYAPRLPDGKFLPCLFWMGRRLKRLLCMLVGYRRPRRSRVKTARQSPPLSQTEREKSLSFWRGLRATLAQHLGPRRL
jgi:hypothetical protein